MGGTTLGVYYLMKEVPHKIDPMDPLNKLFFTTSPLTGVKFSGNARHSVSCVSPLTGGLASSEAGGWWGAALKLAGYDAIAIEGTSEKPVYLFVSDEGSELLDAADLWGKTTGDVQLILKERHGKTCRVLQTGPAGENLVHYACITNELRHFNGRGGTGAVMGRKKIRAIVVKNERVTLPTHDPERLKELSLYLSKDIKNHPALGPHGELGTTRFLLPTNAGGMLPTHNFRNGSFEDAEKVSGEEIYRLYGDGSHTCFGCAVSCKRKMKKIEDYKHNTALYGGPEYETMGNLGPLLGINDPKAIVELGALCNALGLDTISTGAVLAWYIEVCQKEPELLPKGAPVADKWNDSETMKELIELIVNQEGIGALLAKGSKAAAGILGGHSLEYAMQVKGQEFPAHEPRGKWGVGLGMAVNAAGADHLVAAHDVVFDHEGDDGTTFGGADLTDINPVGLVDVVPSKTLSPAKVRNFVYLQQLWSLMDTLSWCKFTAVPETRSYRLNQVVEFVEKVTGWQTSLFELMKTAERGINLSRLFNIRMGFTKTDDNLPERMFKPLESGLLKGQKIDREEFKAALDLYYEMMGWDEGGIPRYGKLAELGIEEFAV